MTTKTDKDVGTDSIIKNADTAVRRAWIDSALAGVRAHLSLSAFVPPVTDAAGCESPLPEETEAAAPRLYLAWSNEKRSA